MAIEGSSFELGVISDPRAIRQFLSELEVVPAALKRISQAISTVDLGDGRKFAGDGRKLAEAFVQAARSELSGGSFQRAFREAMSGVDLRIPREAEAHLRADLERINTEIRRLLPQQVQIGIRANTSGQSFREVLQQQAPQAFAPTQQQQQQLTLAQIREQARQLRAAAAGGSGGGSNFGITEGDSARGLTPSGPSEALTAVRRFTAQQPQRDQAQGKLEEQAYAEDAKREQNRVRHAQALGKLEEQAYAEDAKREQARTLATQRVGRLEERAYAEDAKRSALADPNSSEATLARAAEAARQLKIQTQQHFDQNPDDARLVEQARLRTLNRDAQREQLRQGGPLDQVKAGLLGFGSGTFLERQASIVSTTASFAAGGMAFQAVMNGLTEVVSGTRQFEEALSNLSVTFGDSTNNLRGFATTVGADANAIGLTQAQGVEAASRSVGLFNTTGQSQQDKQDFAQLAVQVTGRIAQQSGTQDLNGVETNLAGILRSFQLSNSDLTRVEDSIAVIAKQTGGNQADILQAASQTATLARAAGFDAFQNSAIIANQATTTGQTAGAAADQLAQVFAQASSAQVAAKFNSLGINTNSTLAEQFQALAGKVQSGQVSQQEFGDISALFGRSRSGAAFQNLIQNLPRVNQLADQARNSPGEGQRQFEQVFGNISSEITKTVGALRNLATELSQSGMLDLLGALIVVVHQTAVALTEVLHLFNEIPRPLRSAAFAIGELVVAAKLLGATTTGSRLLAFLGGNTAVGQRALGALSPTVAESVAARSGAGAAGASSLALLANPATIAAIGAVVAIIAAQKIGDADQAAQRAEGRAITSAANASTAEQLRGAASDRRQAAQAQQGRQNAFLGLGNVVDFFSGSPAAKAAARDNRLGAALDARAAVVEKAQLATNAETEARFGRFNSPDEITAQLQRLQAEGLTAAQRVQALSTAFDQVAATADKAGVAVIHAGAAPLFGQGIAAGLTGAIGAGATQADLRGQSTDIADSGNLFADTLSGIAASLSAPFGGTKGIDTGKSDQLFALRDKLQGTDTAKLQSDVSKHIADVLASRGVDTSKGDTVLSQDDIAAIEGAANEDLQKFINTVIPQGPQFDEIRRIIQNSFKANLAQSIKAFTSGVGVSADQAVNFFTATQQEANNAFNDDSFRNKAAASAQRVNTLQSALAKAKAAVSGGATHDEGSKDSQNNNIQRLQDAQTAVDQAVVDDQKVQLERTQAIIRLRESRRGSLDQSGRLADELDAAKAAVAAATDPTDKANAQAQVNAVAAQQATLALDTATSIGRAAVDPRDQLGQARAAITDAKRRLDFANANGDAKAIADATSSLHDAQINSLQAQVGIINARRTASTPIGDAVAAARTALGNAKAEQGATLRGTQAYYEAIAQVTQARQAVTQALLDRQQREALLHIDITDPVAQARAAVQDAQRRLRAATGTDDRDKAKGDLQQAQVNAESAAFQQRLSDVQTADQLGRISHQQYLSYLHSEHDRLASIKDKTRQQQDELNQVDLLIKQSAQELSGQFNLGNIKLPTVYEVRRSIKAGAGGILAANNGFAGATNGQVVNDNSQRTLVIQGVSMEEVMRRVTALYGGKPVRPTTGRKV